MAIDLKTKLSAYWSADGVFTDSHNSQHLTQTGTVGTGTGHVYESAWSFDGSSHNNYLEVASNVNLQVGGVSFTVAAWFNLAGTDSISGSHVIAGKWHNNQHEWQIAYQTNRLRGQIRESTTGSFRTAISSDALAANTWHFVVFWVDVSTGKIHMETNGADPIVVDLENPIVSAAAAVQIGAEPNNLLSCNGLIGPVAIWRDRVLTADERAYLYNSGSGRPYSEFVEAGGGVSWPLIRRIAALGDLRFSPSGVSY